VLNVGVEDVEELVVVVVVLEEERLLLLLLLSFELLLELLLSPLKVRGSRTTKNGFHRLYLLISDLSHKV